MSFQDIAYQHDPYPQSEMEQIADRIWALEEQIDCWKHALSQGNVAQKIGEKIISRLEDQVDFFHDRLSQIPMTNEVPF